MKARYPAVRADIYVHWNDFLSTHIVNESMLCWCRLSCMQSIVDRGFKAKRYSSVVLPYDGVVLSEFKWI